MPPRKKYSKAKSKELEKRSNTGRKPKNGKVSLKDRLREHFKDYNFKCTDDELMAHFKDYWPTDILVAISTLKNERYAGRGGVFIINRTGIAEGIYQRGRKIA